MIAFFVDALGNGNYVYNALIAPTGSNPAVSVYDKWHFLRNNTFATTHLMLLQTTDTISNNIAYGWYTLPADFGSISGVVYDSTGTPITAGNVVLYREYSNFTKNDILAEVSVDNGGHYQFDSIPFGEYRIAARADINLYPNAITTYYGDTTNWITCPTVVTSSDTTLGVNINLLYHAPVSGTANVNGNIQLDLAVGKMERSPRAGDPIPGVDISIEQVPGGIIASQSSSDSTGNFTITDLQDGDYELFVDIPGLHMAGTYAFTVVDGDVVSELNFVVGMDSIFPTSEPVISATSLNEVSNANKISVHPNPFSSEIYVSIERNSEEILSIVIYDAMGRMIVQQSPQLTAGINRLKLDAAHFESGIYLMNILSDKEGIWVPIKWLRDSSYPPIEIILRFLENMVSP